MADSFRIGSGDGKTPEISKKPIDSTILEKIDLMEPATAFVAVQGIVVPTLNQLKKDLSYLSASLKPSDLPSPMQLADTRESIFLKLKSLDAQAAFMYLTTVVIPFLQNESAKVLEKQGKMMEQVSKAFDKWNEIQDGINNFNKIIADIKKKGLIDESGNLKITNIVDYKSEFDNYRNYKIVWIEDPDNSFKPLIDAKESLDAKINEMQNLLKDLESKLPPSQKTLITTLKELTTNLVLKREKNYRFYYFPDNKSSLRFEIREDLVNLPNNKDFDYMKKFIFSAMRDEYLFMVDEDQTKFKAYMDNISQGITALTSISNVTQQELQLASQYHNTLLGLQKTAYDAISKVVQVATKTPPP